MMRVYTIIVVDILHVTFCCFHNELDEESEGRLSIRAALPQSDGLLDWLDRHLCLCSWKSTICKNRVLSVKRWFLTDRTLSQLMKSVHGKNPDFLTKTIYLFYFSNTASPERKMKRIHILGITIFSLLIFYVSLFLTSNICSCINGISEQIIDRKNVKFCWMKRYKKKKSEIMYSKYVTVNLFLLFL